MARTLAGARTAVTRSNNILYNGGFEVRPSYTADTNFGGRWIDGTANGSAARTGYGWATPSVGSGVGVNAATSFDTAQFRSGAASLRLSTLTVTGTCVVSTYRNTPIPSTSAELFRLQPNTSYTVSAYVRTNNVPASGAFIDLREYNAATTTLATTSTTKVGGTDLSWRLVTVAFVTNASTVFGALLLRNNIAGNICDVWFDDISITPNNQARTTSGARSAA